MLGIPIYLNLMISQKAEYFFNKGIEKLTSEDKLGALRDFNKAKEIENKNENAIDMNELTFDYKKLTDSFNK